MFTGTGKAKINESGKPCADGDFTLTLTRCTPATNRGVYYVQEYTVDASSNPGTLPGETVSITFDMAKPTTTRPNLLEMLAAVLGHDIHAPGVKAKFEAWAEQHPGGTHPEGMTKADVFLNGSLVAGNPLLGRKVRVHSEGRVSQSSGKPYQRRSFSIVAGAIPVPIA